MVRRVANQVHKQVARLARSNFVTEPVWYKAVLEHPPLPLPPKAPPNRIPFNGLPYDLPSPQKDSYGKPPKKPAKPQTPPIVYVEDEIRRQFFRDHPFEVYRERTLVELGLIEEEHPVRGPKWTRLSQRGRNPTTEDAIRFAVNLYEHCNLSLSTAYATAVAQFRSLRSEHHISSIVAIAEAEWFGAVFNKSEIEKGFDREQEYLKSWEEEPMTLQQSLEARKKWKAIIPRQEKEPTYTKGQEYVRLWKEGIRPDYSPALSAPDQSAPQEAEADTEQEELISWPLRR